MSALPEFSMRELIDAGVHFGHKTKRWNPRMAPFIYGTRNDIHIIDLQQTVPMLHRALAAVRATVSKNGRILFVGTKRQASETIAEAAKRCGQYYVDQRWLGGMLTNWSTIQNSIRQLRKYEELLADEQSGLTKKEILTTQRNRDKLERSLGGIRDMGGKPDLLFIIDTNCTTDGIDFPIPGNDDATRAIKLYCQLISDAALSGLKQNLKDEGEFGRALSDSENEKEEGLSERQQQEKLTRDNNRKGAAGKNDRNSKSAPKAAPSSSTKKEAFAEEAKKAAGKKKAAETPLFAEEPAADAKPAKKAAKK